jgi:hypothetical protein
MNAVELKAIERAARRTRLMQLNNSAKATAQARADRDKLHAACLRLLQAAEGMDSLYDDESRAEAYAAELEELSQAKDQARDALDIGILAREAARLAAARSGVPGTPAATATPDATSTL